MIVGVLFNNRQSVDVGNVAVAPFRKQWVSGTLIKKYVPTLN